MSSLSALRKTLFWDVDLAKLDHQKDADLIIGRVFDLGNTEEFKAVKKMYGLSRIKKAALTHPFASRKDLNFWSLVLNIPASKLSCTRKHSLKIPNAFLKR